MLCPALEKRMATATIRKTKASETGLNNFSAVNVFSFFFRNRGQNTRPLLTDMHSHLLPGIDDGAKSNEESFAIIDRLMEMGYEKIITTPHIMADYYGGTAESICGGFEKFQPVLKEKGYTLPFHCA